MEMDNNTQECLPCLDCECGCLGYGYVPVQTMQTVFDPQEGLCRGTIFPELELTIEEYGKICKSCGGVS